MQYFVPALVSVQIRPFQPSLRSRYSCSARSITPIFFMSRDFAKRLTRSNNSASNSYVAFFVIFPQTCTDCPATVGVGNGSETVSLMTSGLLRSADDGFAYRNRSPKSYPLLIRSPPKLLPPKHYTLLRLSSSIYNPLPPCAQPEIQEHRKCSEFASAVPENRTTLLPPVP